MPLSPPSTLDSLSLPPPRAPLPPPKRVHFNPTSHSSLNSLSNSLPHSLSTTLEHAYPAHATPTWPTPLRSRFQQLDRLLQPSPALEFTPRLRLEQRFKKSARAPLGERQPEQGSVDQPRAPITSEKSDKPRSTSAAVQTSPVRTTPRHSSANSSSTTAPSSEAPAPAAVPAHKPAIPRPPPAFSPPPSRTSPTRAPAPRPPAASPAPAALPSPPAASPAITLPPPAGPSRSPLFPAASTSPSSSSSPSPAARSPSAPSAPLSGFSTLSLPPIRHLLRPAPAPEVWVELLPPPAAQASAGREGQEWERGGDVLLDCRAKGGVVFLLSGDGEEMSVFRPPPSPSSSSSSAQGPLILLNPLRVHPTRTALFAPLPHPLTDAEQKARKRDQRAWRAVEKVLRVVRSRTGLLTFHPALPASLSSLSATSRPKCTVYSDLPSSPSAPFEPSYALSISLGAETTLSVYVSPPRDLVTLTITSASPASGPAIPSKRHTCAHSAPLSTLSSLSALSSVSEQAALDTFLRSALLSSPPSPVPISVLDRAHRAVVFALSPSFRGLVARTRQAHLDALASPPLPTRRWARRSVEDEAKALGAWVVKALGLPEPEPEPGSPLLERRTRPAAVEGRGDAPDADAGKGEEERRCIPGLGWITRLPLSSSPPSSSSSKAEGEEGSETAFEVLFADGDRILLRAHCGGAGGREGKGPGIERVVVEDRKGRRYPLTFPPPRPSSPLQPPATPPDTAIHPPAPSSSPSPPPPALPPKVLRRMGLIVELLGLFIVEKGLDEQVEGWER